MNTYYFYFKKLILMPILLILISCSEMVEPEISELSDFIEIGEAEVGNFQVIFKRVSRDATHRVKIKIKEDLSVIILQNDENFLFSLISDHVMNFNSLNPIEKDQEVFIYRQKVMGSMFDTLRDFKIKYAEISFYDNNRLVRKKFILNKKYEL